MSSSLLPLNIGPQTTSSQPPLPGTFRITAPDPTRGSRRHRSYPCGRAALHRASCGGGSRRARRPRPLTEAGREHARLLGQRFADDGIRAGRRAVQPAPARAGDGRRDRQGRRGRRRSRRAARAGRGPRRRARRGLGPWGRPSSWSATSPTADERSPRSAAGRSPRSRRAPWSRSRSDGRGGRRQRTAQVLR